MKKETVLFFCAHADDEVIGAGGTISKYIEEGKNIVVFIFSFGEKSNLLIKEDWMIKTRVKEAQKIHKKLGVKETIFLGLKDFELEKVIKNKRIMSKIKKLIKEYNPTKIFTLTSTDPHPDHRAVHNIVLKAIDESNYKGDLYTFRIWNIIETRPNIPKMYSDISKFYDKKLGLLDSYKSQRLLDIYPLLPFILINDKLNGIRNRCKFAEVFYKIR